MLKPFKRIRQPLDDVLLVALCCLACSLMLAVRTGRSPLDLAITFANSYYSKTHNLVFAGEFAGINANLALLFLIVFSSLCLNMFRKRKASKSPGASAARDRVPASAFTGILILAVLAGVQTMNFGRYFYRQFHSVHGKTIGQKKAMLFGDLYRFPEFCRRQIPGRSRGRLVTDIDLNSTSGAYTQIALAYHLFPLAIQYNPRQRRIMPDYAVDDPLAGPATVLIVYQKQDPRASVPEHFVIKGYFDDKSLLAARTVP